MVRAGVDCEETDPGDVREEIMVGNASGRKPYRHGSKVMLLSHAKWVEPSPGLSPHIGQYPQLSNREAGPSNAWRTELQSRTPPRGAPSMCLTR